MVGLWVGIGGFIIAILSDFMSVGRLRRLARPGFWIALVLFIFATLETTLWTDRFYLNGSLVLAGWILLPLSLSLLIYSLFIELPFQSTYVLGKSQQNLIIRGTYALTRHPGLLWFGLLLLSLMLLSRSKELLIAAPVWFLFDLLWVVLQDRYIFREIFPDYVIYRRETPMLFPNWSSLKRCIATLGKENT